MLRNYFLTAIRAAQPTRFAPLGSPWSFFRNRGGPISVSVTPTKPSGGLRMRRVPTGRVASSIRRDEYLREQLQRLERGNSEEQ